jgi:hypothetical protein
MNTSNQSTNPGYLLLFRGKDWDQGLSNDELQQVMAKFVTWSQGLANSGKVRGGQALAREGATISGRNRRVVADGPFPEAKEAVGGFLHLDVETLDEAITIAKGCPGLDFDGVIEIRPVLEECPCFKRARQRLELAAA